MEISSENIKCPGRYTVKYKHNVMVLAITLGGHLGKADLKSGKEVTPGHVSSFGVPKTLQQIRFC